VADRVPHSRDDDALTDRTGLGGRSDERAACRPRRPRARPRGAALLSLSV